MYFVEKIYIFLLEPGKKFYKREKIYQRKGTDTMNHSFNVEIAVKYGMLEAVLLENINFWITKNKANNVQYYDGHYWTYNSVKALSELFPYASKATISRALHHLENEGLILSGNYNKSAYDRTIWYTITEKYYFLSEGKDVIQDGESTSLDNAQDGQCISQNETSIPQNDNIHFSKCKMEISKMSNGFTQSEQPIPDINTDINTDVNLTVSNDTVCRTDVQRVAEHWNQLAAYGIKPVSRISSGAKRFDMLRARIRTYGVGKIFEAIENIKKSSFLCGSGQKGWVITFDWFVRPNNFIKVLEGNYEGVEDKGSRNKSSPGSKPNQFNNFTQRDCTPENMDSLEKMLLAKNKHPA